MSVIAVFKCDWCNKTVESFIWSDKLGLPAGWFKLDNGTQTFRHICYSCYSTGKI